MPQPPRLMVHSLSQAEAALRAAAMCGVPVILESPPAAARYWGAPYFVKLIEAAREAVPAAACDAILDCGDAPGLALDALHHGIRTVRLRGRKDVVARVADIAAQLGARIETKPRPKTVLDLQSTHDHYEAARRHIEGQKG